MYGFIFVLFFGDLIKNLGIYTTSYLIFSFKLVELSNVLRITQKNKTFGEQGAQYTLATFFVQPFRLISEKLEVSFSGNNSTLPFCRYFMR